MAFYCLVQFGFNLLTCYYICGDEAPGGSSMEVACLRRYDLLFTFTQVLHGHINDSWQPLYSSKPCSSHICLCKTMETWTNQEVTTATFDVIIHNIISKSGLRAEIDESRSGVMDTSLVASHQKHIRPRPDICYIALLCQPPISICLVCDSFQYKYQYYRSSLSKRPWVLNWDF